MPGPTCIFWANLTLFSLKLNDGFFEWQQDYDAAWYEALRACISEGGADVPRDGRLGAAGAGGLGPAEVARRRGCEEAALAKHWELRRSPAFRSLMAAVQGACQAY
jgi:hypothetical protein